MATDDRTFNRRCLDNVNALIEGRSSTDVIEWANTAGIDLKKETFDSLIKRKTYFERLVAKEEGSYVPLISFRAQSDPY